MSSSSSSPPQGTGPRSLTPAPQPPAGSGPTTTASAGDTTVAPEEERELWRGRMSWKHRAGRWFLWGIAATLLVWLWLHFRPQVETPWLGRIVLLVILGSAAGLFVQSALVVYGTRYRLTTQRLFVEQGILSRTTDQIELIRVDDVRLHQSLFDRIFSLGNIELVAPSDATQPSVRLVGIPDPHPVMEHVRMHSRALRMKRSLFVEQM